MHAGIRHGPGHLDSHRPPARRLSGHHHRWDRELGGSGSRAGLAAGPPPTACPIHVTRGRTSHACPCCPQAPSQPPPAPSDQARCLTSVTHAQRPPGGTPGHLPPTGALSPPGLAPLPLPHQGPAHSALAQLDPDPGPPWCSEAGRRGLPAQPRSQDRRGLARAGTWTWGQDADCRRGGRNQ